MKIGRNDQCPCGSGKKYKHCHYDKDLEARQASAAAALEEAEARAAEEKSEDAVDETDTNRKLPDGHGRSGKAPIPGKSGSRVRNPESKSRVQRGSQRGN